MQHQAAMHQTTRLQYAPIAPDHHLHQNPCQEFHLDKKRQGPLSSYRVAGTQLLVTRVCCYLPHLLRSLLSLLLPV